MSSSEREASERKVEEGSAQLTEDALCIRLFCKTLTDLNTIGEQQMRSLLNIAVAAVETANSLYSSQTNRGTGSGQSNEQLKELIAQLKSSADKIGQTDGAAADGEQVAASSADTVCHNVERNLNLAMLNSLSFQQELNVLGQSILAQAASLLFSAVGANLNDAGQNS